MSYHAKNGCEFVGLRRNLSGRKQVIYDAETGERVVLNIQNHLVSESDIDAALQEGIAGRNVLGSIIAALKSRDIDVDFASKP